MAIAISTLGFLSQAMLSYPRVAFAMAEDGVLPGIFARLGARSRAPVAAIALLGALISATVLLGTYEQILSYVVVMDWLFFGLSASCLFVFRARDARRGGAARCRNVATACLDIRGPPAFLLRSRGWWYSTPFTNILAMQAWLCVFFSLGFPSISCFAGS